MTGRDGTGRDGTGRDGTGRDGTYREPDAKPIKVNQIDQDKLIAKKSDTKNEKKTNDRITLIYILF